MTEDSEYIYVRDHKRDNEKDNKSHMDFHIGFTITFNSVIKLLLLKINFKWALDNGKDDLIVKREKIGIQFKSLSLRLVSSFVSLIGKWIKAYSLI